MIVRPKTWNGFGWGRPSKVTFAKIRLSMAPWESADLPEHIAEEVERRTEGGIGRYEESEEIQVYQLRAMFSCH